MDWIEFLILIKGWSTLSIVLRLLFSVVTGTVIGLDRAIKRRGAGIKTHVLVSLGSALVMMTGQFIQLNYEGTMDVARLGAQLISGVGFLGVGTIIVTGQHQVKGLTTAAGLWACACIGLAVGIGFIDGALLALFFVIFSFKVLSKIDNIVQNRSRYYDLYIEFPTNKCVSLFINELHNQEVKIISFELGDSKINGEGTNAILSIQLKNRKQNKTIFSDLRQMDCVKYMELL